MSASEHRQPAEILAAFRPSPDALLDLLRPRMIPEMLWEIAAADYETQVSGHFRALRRICKTGKLPHPLGWEPNEVLELIRWSEPNDPQWKPGRVGPTGHLMRAFACGVLLRAAADPECKYELQGENPTVAPLVASALELGADVQAAAAQFLAWDIQRPEEHEERCFYALALLILAVFLGKERFPEDFLGEIAAWVLAEEAHENRGLASRLPERADQWMFGATMYDLKHATWRELGRKLIVEAGSIRSPQVRWRIRKIGGRVLRLDRPRRHSGT